MKKVYELLQYEYDNDKEAGEHEREMRKQGYKVKDSWLNSETESTVQYEKWNE